MFEDVSDLIARNPPGRFTGVAVAELERGRPSVVVAAEGGPTRVLSWSAGALRDTAPPELSDRGGRAAGVTAGDLDGDGREELYVSGVTSSGGGKGTADRLFRCGPGGWFDLLACPSNRAARSRSPGRAVAALDRRGVGRYGFAVATAGRPLRLLELNPAGVLTDLAPALGLVCPVEARGLLALPLFSPTPDLFCVSEDGPNRLFRNCGNGTFEDVAAKLRLRDCTERACAAAAFDLGGKFGLVWANEDGPHRLMTYSDGAWKDVATPAFAFPSAARAVMAADFDNDGNDELFLTHAGEPNRLFRLTPPELQQGANAPRSPRVEMLAPGDALDPEGFGAGAAVADIDGDGVLELVVARGADRAEPLAVYKVRAAGGNWLRVRPLTRFGAPARGAVVRAECAGRVRVKAIDAGGGLCQSEPVAHFGLGDATAVERVLVTWPDGAAVAVLNTGGNRLLTVPYPRG